ncbi:hypothetical protein PO124_20170 [Bacillus licheniformis]|nr:hypothetical protein [Bacillus licheniformis]
MGEPDVGYEMCSKPSGQDERLNTSWWLRLLCRLKQLSSIRTVRRCFETEPHRGLHYRTLITEFMTDY